MKEDYKINKILDALNEIYEHSISIKRNLSALSPALADRDTAYRYARKLTRFQTEIMRIREEYRSLQDLSSALLIGVFGEFSAGKSMFINSLLGENFLKTDVKPTTARVSIIKYGDQKKIFGFKKDGKKTIKELLEKKDYDLYNNKDESKKDQLYDYFEIYYPSPVLRSIILVDTPGFSELFKEMDSVTNEWIQKVHAVFWVVDSNQGITGEAKKKLQQYFFGRKPTFCILNKMDTIAPKDRERISKNVTEKFKEFEGVVKYSAKEVLLAKEKDRDLENIQKKVLKKLTSFISEAEDIKIWIEKKSRGRKTYVYYCMGNNKVKLGCIKQSEIDKYLKNSEKVLEDIIKKFRDSRRELKERKLKGEIEGIIEEFWDLLIKVQSDTYIWEDDLKKKWEGECCDWEEYLKKQYSKHKKKMIMNIEEALLHYNDLRDDSIYDCISDLAKRLIEGLSENLRRKEYPNFDINEFTEKLERNVKPFEEASKNVLEALKNILNKEGCEECFEINYREEWFENIVDALIADEQIYESIVIQIKSLIDNLKKRELEELENIRKLIDKIEKKIYKIELLKKEVKNAVNQEF